VVVVVDEPDVVPGFVPLDVVVLAPFVCVLVLLVAFHGCHTKSAISATTTMTAIKLKVASDPPFSRSTEMLRSSIRQCPSGVPKGSSTQQAAGL
jgi:Kef-type K+ transport system membrane component KefB